MHFTYILKSFINHSYYVGSCKNIDERFNLHNAGKVKSTKRYIPWEIVHTEKYKSLSSARKRELQIKSWKSRIAIEKLIKDFNI
jgi:putative endonuclease